MKDGTTKELFCQIKETLSSSVNGDSDTSLLLIDDLSLLVSLGLKPIQVDQLVHYCMATLVSFLCIAHLFLILAMATPWESFSSEHAVSYRVSQKKVYSSFLGKR